MRVKNGRWVVLGQAERPGIAGIVLLVGLLWGSLWLGGGLVLAATDGAADTMRELGVKAAGIQVPWSMRGRLRILRCGFTLRPLAARLT